MRYPARTKERERVAGPLVRAVWRRLPVGFRRGLAHGALARFAPPLPALEPMGEGAPHIVVGFLSSPSGLGQAARLAMRALEAQGKRVYGVDLGAHFFELGDNVAFAYRDGRALRGPAHVLININAPYLAYVFQLLGRAFLRHKQITAYWAWELERAPESWRAGLARAHRIATPSRFVADAIRALGDGPPIVVAPHPVALEDIPLLPARDAAVSPEAPFTVAFACNLASGFARKNPLALVAAFRAAFAGRRDARLRLLATGGAHYPEGMAQLRAAIGDDPAIELSTSALDRAGYWRWLGRPDLFASLHRAEGFGLGLAEAMCAGVPTLATGWSANAEYMNENNSLIVKYSLIPVIDPQRKYASGNGRWAEPDVADAAAQMRRAAAEPMLLQRLAATARDDARRRFSAFPI